MTRDLVDIFESNSREFYYAKRISDDVRLRHFDCPNCEYEFDVESRSVTRCPYCDELIDNDGNIGYMETR